MLCHALPALMFFFSRPALMWFSAQSILQQHATSLCPCNAGQTFSFYLALRRLCSYPHDGSPQDIVRHLGPYIQGIQCPWLVVSLKNVSRCCWVLAPFECFRRITVGLLRTKTMLRNAGIKHKQDEWCVTFHNQILHFFGCYLCFDRKLFHSYMIRESCGCNKTIKYKTWSQIY